MADMPDIPGAEHRFTEIQTVDAGTLNIHFYEAGDGPPVVMLHGWPEHAWCWRRVVPQLAPHHRVICPDLRGFGWSDAPGHGYDPETFASDTIALLDALELDEVDLVGHDWGGYAGFLVALQHPERIRHYLPLNTVSPWVRPSPAVLANMWRSWYAVLNALPLVGGRLQRITGWGGWLLAADDAVPKEEAAVYAERLQRPESARAAQQLYRGYLRRALDLGRRGVYDHMRLTVPTHFVFGLRDKAISHHLALGWEDHADDMWIEWVEDAGHFIQEEKPDLVAARALEFFSR